MQALASEHGGGAGGVDETPSWVNWTGEPWQWLLVGLYVCTALGYVWLYALVDKLERRQGASGAGNTPSGAVAADRASPAEPSATRPRSSKKSKKSNDNAGAQPQTPAGAKSSKKSSKRSSKKRL